ncbi:MAG: CerR family C-terminal domain-containing protein [Victivallales bacterium]|nr:CerR family C-terminal domain-containing protein [Victivallales bacterium]
MNTKEKILLTAAEEFAKNGYHRTTIREICESAKVNISAINYHFNSKENLYKTVVDYLFEKVLNDSIEFNFTNLKEWKTEFKKLILDYLEKVMGKSLYGSFLNRILFREMIDPSIIFYTIHKEYIQKHFSRLKKFINYISVQADSEENLNLLVYTLASQYIFYGQNKYLVSLELGDEYLNSHENLDYLAGFITENCYSILRSRKKINLL